VENQRAWHTAFKPKTVKGEGDKADEKNKKAPGDRDNLRNIDEASESVRR